MGRLPLSKRMYAEAGAFVTRHPFLREKVAGDPHPRISWLKFYVANTTADELDLATFQGDPKAGSNRATWQIGAAAVHGMRYAEEIGKPENGSGCRAVTFAADEDEGAALLVAAIPPKHMQRWMGETEVGMGVGPGGLRWAPVVWRLLDNTLVIPEGGFTVVGEKDAHGRVAPQYANIDAAPPQMAAY